MSIPGVTATPVPAVLSIDNPSALEPCDKCGAHGLWRVVFTTGELVFCAHHAVANGFVARGTSHVAYQNETRSKGSDHA